MPLPFRCNLTLGRGDQVDEADRARGAAAAAIKEQLEAAVAAKQRADMLLTDVAVARAYQERLDRRTSTAAVDPATAGPSRRPATPRRQSPLRCQRFTESEPSSSPTLVDTESDTPSLDSCDELSPPPHNRNHGRHDVVKQLDHGKVRSKLKPPLSVGVPILCMLAWFCPFDV